MFNFRLTNELNPNSKKKIFWQFLNPLIRPNQAKWPTNDKLVAIVNPFINHCLTCLVVCLLLIKINRFKPNTTHPTDKFFYFSPSFTKKILTDVYLQKRIKLSWVQNWKEICQGPFNNNLKHFSFSKSNLMSYYLKFTKCDSIIQFISKLFYCLSTYLSLPCLPSYRVIEAWTSSWSLIQQKDHIHANPLFCVIYNLFWIVKLQNMTIYAEYRVQGAPTNKIRKHFLNFEE